MNDKDNRDQKLDDFIFLPLESLNLSKKTNIILKLSDINTINDLLKKSETDLMQIKSLGSKSIKEIVKKLMNLRLFLNRTKPGIPIEILNLSTWSENSLKRASIETIDDLTSLHDFQLEKIRGIGKKASNEIKQKLFGIGYSLKGK